MEALRIAALFPRRRFVRVRHQSATDAIIEFGGKFFAKGAAAVAVQRRQSLRSLRRESLNFGFRNQSTAANTNKLNFSGASQPVNCRAGQIQQPGRIVDCMRARLNTGGAIHFEH
jgi:hypothetical protein